LSDLCSSQGASSSIGREMTSRLKKYLMLIPMLAAVAISAGFASGDSAIADGKSDLAFGCYSNWWGTAANSNCIQATMTSHYNNQYVCSYTGGIVHFTAGTLVYKNHALYGFNFVDDCWFSVDWASTVL